MFCWMNKVYSDLISPLNFAFKFLTLGLPVARSYFAMSAMSSLAVLVVIKVCGNKG